MKTYVEHIIFYRDLAPEHAEQLRELIASDPEAAKAFCTWRRLRDAVGRQLDDAVGSRELFVLFILSEYGHRALLTEEERTRADKVALQYREAISRHLGLQGAAAEIDDAVRHFDAEWEAWFGDDRVPTRSSRTRARSDRPGRPSRKPATRWSVRIAMVAALAAFATILILVLQRDHGMIMVETAEGEMRTVELGAGSTARLLGASRLSFTPPDEAAPIGRRLLLEGSAFFEIAPAREGLVLNTATAQLTVLGTSFGVREDEQSTEVVLAEGRLSLASRGAPSRAVVLESGQMSSVGAESPPTTPERVRVHERLSWTGLFVFASTPLEDILAELGRHYQVNVSTSPELNGERITGRFEHDQDLTEILRTLAGALDAELQTTPNGGYILAPL